ncbi:MAG: ATP-binding protein [Arcobacter sp.]|uniref:ATP-binding protein n=1 Tax=Arcobacter sp. TaxID=1872629 RepID=UPI003AFF79A4
MKQYLIKNNIYIVLITLLVLFFLMIYTIVIHKKNTQIFFDHNDQINTIMALNNKLNSYILGNSAVNNFDILNRDINRSLDSIEKLKNDALLANFQTLYIKALDNLYILFNKKIVWLERFKARRATNNQTILLILDRSHHELLNFDLETKNKLHNIRIDILEKIEQNRSYDIDIIKHYDLELNNTFIINFLKKVKTIQKSINFQLKYQDIAINKDIDNLLNYTKQLLLKQRETAQNSVYITLNILYVLVTIFLILFTLFYRKLKQSQKQLQNLTYQSKLASMGEMIGNIAHQWRQPLTHISYILMNIKTAYEKDKLTTEYFEKKSKLANAQIKYLSDTIDDFRDFFKNTNQKELFNLSTSIKEVTNLLKDSFKAYNISIEYDLDDNISIKAYRGEFLQVLFNIFNNAKDEFIKREISNAKLTIKTYTKKDSIKVEIKDNAGGIKNELLEKIFEPYFTTKDKGLGIGLYMSKIIVEKSDARLEVQNIKGGASFIITFK